MACDNLKARTDKGSMEQRKSEMVSGLIEQRKTEMVDPWSNESQRWLDSNQDRKI